MAKQKRGTSFKNRFLLISFFIFSFTLTSCEVSEELYQKVQVSQKKMLEAYKSQNKNYSRVLPIRVATLNTFLLNFIFVKNSEYKESLKLYEELITTGAFFEELSFKSGEFPDFIAVQEFFGNKDGELTPILKALDKAGYISVFDLFKSYEKSSRFYKRKKLGLDIWVKRTWLQGKVYGKDFRVGFEQFKTKGGSSLIHILELIAGYKRGVLWIEVMTSDKKKVLMTSTHLTPLELKSWANTRLEQTRFMRSWIEKNDSDFVILSGDMNSSDIYAEKEKRNPPKFSIATRSYNHLISENLFDSFEVLFPEKDGFTYDSLKNKKSSPFLNLDKSWFLKKAAEKDLDRGPVDLKAVAQAVDEYNGKIDGDKQRALFLPSDQMRGKIDLSFFRSSNSHYVDVREAKIVFKKPFKLSGQSEKSYYLSDHYGYMSEVYFWY